MTKEDLLEEEWLRRRAVFITVRELVIESEAARVRVGDFHEAVAERLNCFSSSWLKTMTNESLKELGVRRVIVNGYPWFCLSERKTLCSPYT